MEIGTSREGLRFSHRLIPNPAPRLPPVLFVSGAFQTMNSWSKFARAFAPHATVLLVDPPGMGGSDHLPAEFGLDFLAGCLEQVLDERGIEQVDIVSASYGTPAAFRLAQLRPDRVRRLVLAGTMKELPAHLRARIAGTIDLARRLDREALAFEVVDGMLCQDPAVEIERRAMAARVLKSSVTRMSDSELLKYAANTERLLNHEPLDLRSVVRGPEALVFTGEHDCFTYPHYCREVAGAFERFHFTTIRRADHLFHLQQFDAVLEILLRFFAGTLAPAATKDWNAMTRSRAVDASAKAHEAAVARAPVR